MCKLSIFYLISRHFRINKTIVLVGDHPTMAQQYVNDVPSDYQRTTYNCFINSKVTTDQIKTISKTCM